MHRPPRVFVDLSPVDLTPFELSADAVLPGTIGLSKADSRHLRDVLRLVPGDVLIAVCRSTHREFQSTIATIDSKVTIQLNEEQKRVPRTIVVNTLAIAITKGWRPDLVCEKATELGVANIIIWKGEHSVVRVSDPTKKTARWQRIAEEAAKQCCCERIPSVSYASDIAQAVTAAQANSAGRSDNLFCSLTAGAKPLADALTSGHPAVVFVGPEGDLSEREEEFLESAGYRPVTLGPLILRSDTAAIACVAMIQAIASSRQ